MQNPISLKEALDQLRDRSGSEVEKGRLFEQLIKGALLVDPVWKEQFSEIYSWRKWSSRLDLVRQDTGIDLVAHLSAAQGGGYAAIQCKFYDPDKSQIDKKAIDSFLSASGREFLDSQQRKCGFARRIVVTSLEHWTKHAEEAIRDQTIPVTRVDLNELQDFQVDWAELSRPKVRSSRPAKKLRGYQKEAVQKVCAAFHQGAKRGQLIMACGTGKTVVGLRIAEKQVPARGTVLVLMPSLSLLSQTLREWVADSSRTLFPLAVCSDSQVHRNENEDISPVDMVIPPTTDAAKLAGALLASHDRNGGNRPMTVVFATYQSLGVIREAQQINRQQDRPTPFDLVLADEAHRTVGTQKRTRGTNIKATGDKETPLFTRVHDDEVVAARQRLYMTATPKVYGATVVSKAKEEEVAIYSMNDEKVYGKVLYRYSFSAAVRAGHLADYRVLVLGLDCNHERGILKEVLDRKTAEGSQIHLPEAVKMLGCWQALRNPLAKGLRKTASSQEESRGEGNGSYVQLRRVLFFSGTIAASKRIETDFCDVVAAAGKYLERHEQLAPQVKHVDGTMNALRRNQILDWLRAEMPEEECRVISNVRCLTEGVDVPALDGVVFFSPRKSQVDIVQAVGRVMRKTDEKELGYIILPVAVMPEEDPKDFLQNNETYRHVWQVLAALRAHDERFEAEINQIEFTHRLPANLDIIFPRSNGTGRQRDEVRESDAAEQVMQRSLDFWQIPREQWLEIINPRLVKFCGSRRYWTDWAQTVARIAREVSTEIEKKAASDDHFRECFLKFLKGLRANIHPGIEKEQATEMLAQHWITKPVFNTLFERYNFSERNPVSRSIDSIFRKMEMKGMGGNLEELQKFYKDVADRAAGIDTLAGRQNIMERLYQEFFAKAFKKDADRLGIVYTPTEVADFILRSADHVLRKEFGRRLSDEGVHVLDPFSGTGRFLVRLLADNALVRDSDLERKYQSELHMNEIMLLPYYIGNVNVEQACHSRRMEKQSAAVKAEGYVPFAGGVLTDTFQLHEPGESSKDLFQDVLPLNSKQAEHQKQTPIEVIVGNPPYSLRQKSANDANQNRKYTKLAKRIQETFVAQSKAQSNQSSYDSYILAIRWALDRLVGDGVVAFITNGGFLDGKSTDGVRKCLREECSAVYVLNLRGDANTQGEQRRKEKDGIFGAKSRVTTAILVLVKRQGWKGSGTVYYHDIGDYLKRKEKLEKLKKAKSLEGIDWQLLQPNEEGDWLDLRDRNFCRYLPLGDPKIKRSTLENDAPQKGFNQDLPLPAGSSKAQSLFSVFTLGTVTNRDAWAWNYSAPALRENMERMIDFYNQELVRFCKECDQGGPLKLEQVPGFVSSDPKQISWSRALHRSLHKKCPARFRQSAIRVGMYRPFCQKYLYYDPLFNEVRYKTRQCWPEAETRNPALGVLGLAGKQEFCVWATDRLPDLNLLTGAQWFPLYWWDDAGVRHSNIAPATLDCFQAGLGACALGPEELFYYAYALLHHPDYRKRYSGNLSREMARLPCVADWQDFRQAGQDLAQLHIDYEEAAPYALQKEELKEPAKTSRKNAGSTTSLRYVDRSHKAVIVNGQFVLSGVPASAHSHEVNGKSLPDWVVSNCQSIVDKKSGLRSDPAAFSEDPEYLPDLFAKAVRVGVESSKIVAGLPDLRILSENRNE